MLKTETEVTNHLERSAPAYVPPSQRKRLDVKEYSHLQLAQSSKKNNDFEGICHSAKQYVYRIYDQKIDDHSRGKTKEDYVVIFHEAMLGIPSSVSHVKKIIEDYITEEGLRSSSYPVPYTNLIDAIFEEEFGWGVLSAYRQENNCEAAQIIGTDVTFKRKWGWELQPFRFQSIDKVLELAQRFANMHAKTNLSEHTNPTLETRTHDNIRVSIMIPERTHEEPVITLRKKIVQDINFQSMIDYQTIPSESLPLFKAMAKFNLNSVIAGPPGCGKSTMLQAFLSHSLFEVRQGKRIPERRKTVYIEKFPEWDIRKLHPHSNALHVLGDGKDFEDSISSTLLRHDISSIVIGEIREHEVGLYRRASVQGIKKLMGTLHDLDPINIPGIMRDLYLQYFPTSISSDTLQRTFNNNLHFAVSMDEFLNDDDEYVKKVTGVHIYDPIGEGKDMEMYTVMEYDYETDSWAYDATIPARFERLASKYDRKLYREFKQHLTGLAKGTVASV